MSEGSREVGKERWARDTPIKHPMGMEKCIVTHQENTRWGWRNALQRSLRHQNDYEMLKSNVFLSMPTPAKYQHPHIPPHNRPPRTHAKKNKANKQKQKTNTENKNKTNRRRRRKRRTRGGGAGGGGGGRRKRRKKKKKMMIDLSFFFW